MIAKKICISIWELGSRLGTERTPVVMDIMDEECETNIEAYECSTERQIAPVHPHAREENLDDGEDCVENMEGDISPRWLKGRVSAFN